MSLAAFRLGIDIVKNPEKFGWQALAEPEVKGMMDEDELELELLVMEKELQDKGDSIRRGLNSQVERTSNLDKMRVLRNKIAQKKANAAVKKKPDGAAGDG